jgi:hypothetical protein
VAESKATAISEHPSVIILAYITCKQEKALGKDRQNKK